MTSVPNRAMRRVLAAACVASFAPVAFAQEMSMMPAATQAGLVRGLLPMVVNITARTSVTDAQDPVMASAKASAAVAVKTAAGSGFVIEPTGEIATNWHVVNGAFDIQVTFSDGSHAKADLVAASPLVDLAVIKVNAGKKLPAVRWADSAKVQIGDSVLAIGNPLGIGMSVSGGIVSALNRNIMDTPYDDFIQTDAAINHGNSGGPLFDLKGDVVGVNSAIISPTAANAGLGFAMPSNDARFIFDRLTHKGFARPGYIGARLQPVTADMALAIGQSEPEGSIVASVEPDSPANVAGLRAGDIILRFGAEKPGDERELRRAIAKAPPGSTVTLTVRRQGQDIALPVAIAQWPVMWWETSKPSAPHISIPDDLGLSVAALNDQMRASYDIASPAGGALITGVMPGTDAAQRGLAQGDVIEQIGDAAVANGDDVQREIDKARADKREFALFLVMRKNQTVTPAQEKGPKWLALRVQGG